jgi:catechol O-methyltransferase
MPYWAAITSSFIELAGLKDIVEVVVGDASTSLKRLHAEGKLHSGSVDMVLLDHWEKFYVSDLQVCEELGILRAGTTILADNVLAPGAPAYKKYVDEGKAVKSREGLSYSTKSIDSIMPNGWKVSSSAKLCIRLRN